MVSHGLGRPDRAGVGEPAEIALDEYGDYPVRASAAHGDWCLALGKPVQVTVYLLLQR